MRPRAIGLRYRSDRRPLLIVSIAACLTLLPFAIGWSRLPLWAIPVLWLVSLYARTHCPYAQHNHGHLPAFGARALNHAYDVLLAFVTGYPTALWELHHNLGHHRNFLDPSKDVASVMGKGRDGTSVPVSRLVYALRGNATIHRDSYRIARAEAARGKPRLLRKLGFELAVQAIVLAALCAWDARLTVIYVVLPNLFAGFMVWWESYVHHLDVPGTNIYDASVTVTGARFNHANFNIGHHTAHHEKPTLHWSLLPERTAKIFARIPSTCVREDEGPGHVPRAARAAAAALSAPERASAPVMAFDDAIDPGE